VNEKESQTRIISRVGVAEQLLNGLHLKNANWMKVVIAKRFSCPFALDDRPI